MRFGGVILAAGASRRMGRNKLLIEIDGEPLVRRAAQRALLAGLEPVVVVVGFEAAQVRSALAGLSVSFAENADFTGPPASSLRVGLASLPPDTDGAVCLLADMVRVTERMLAVLAVTARRSGTPMVASRYGDVVAPPYLFRRELFGDVLEAAALGSGKVLVDRLRDRLVFVDWPESCLADLDTPDDLTALSPP